MLRESGIMGPLRSLSDVNMALVQVFQQWEQNYQKLQPKYEEMLRDLEDDIEDDEFTWTDSGDSISCGVASSEGEDFSEEESGDDFFGTRSERCR